MENQDSLEIINFLKQMQRKAMISAYAHFAASDHARKLELSFGIPVIIINVFLGSVLAADIAETVPIIMKWVGALLALLAASLASLQTFLGPKKRKTMHKRIANSYLNIARSFEMLLAQYNDGILKLELIPSKIQDLTNKYDETNDLTEDYPTSHNDYNVALRRIDAWERRKGIISHGNNFKSADREKLG